MTVATPNLFELSWLTGTTPNPPAEAVQAARQLGVPTVVVTSAAETATVVATLLVGKDKRMERESPRRAGIPNGAGDLFAAGFLFGLTQEQLSRTLFPLGGLSHLPIDSVAGVPDTTTAHTLRWFIGVLY